MLYYSCSLWTENISEQTDKSRDHSDSSLKESTSSPKQKQTEQLVVKIANCVSPVHEMANKQVVQWLRENKLNEWVKNYEKNSYICLHGFIDGRKTEMFNS